MRSLSQSIPHPLSAFFQFFWPFADLIAKKLTEASPFCGALPKSEPKREIAMLFSRRKMQLPAAADALPGRAEKIATAKSHFVNGRPLAPPYPEGLESILFGMGCFWGAERKFWQAGEGVYVTAAGYAGGFTPNPTYEEVCSGQTGHTEAVLVVFDPKKIALQRLLAIFWESHDPTQFMRQGNDIGTQYRSAIYTTNAAQAAAAEASRAAYQAALKAHGLGEIVTEIAPAGEFYFAEEFHQQYLAKNPDGYCGLGGSGVACPVGVGL
jgi:peptide-methionine (S)-S-oxide reductase